MPDWGEIFANPEMQLLEPNPEFLALIPALKEVGCRRVLDAGCGAGRHLLPLAQAGFLVWGVDREASVLNSLKTRLKGLVSTAYLAQADLRCLPFADASFDLVVSINVINHGEAQTFRDYCREMDLVLKPRGYVFIYISPREFMEHVRLPQTRELEPGTLVDIATPDGQMVHHFPAPEEVRARFSGYRVHREETILAPIPFMGGVELPQLVFWAQKIE